MCERCTTTTGQPMTPEQIDAACAEVAAYLAACETADDPHNPTP